MQTIAIDNNLHIAMNQLEELINSNCHDSVLKILKAYKLDKTLNKSTEDLLISIFNE